MDGRVIEPVMQNAEGPGFLSRYIGPVMEFVNIYYV